MSAGRTGSQKTPRAELRRHNGVPTLFINGKPVSPFSYMTYGPRKRYYADFAKAGIKLFSYPANADSLDLWRMAEVWKGPDEFDYRFEDEMFEMILSAAPDGYIVPRIHTIGPKWWRDANPDELVSYTDGKGEQHVHEWQGKAFPSYASKEGMEMSQEAVRRYIEHVRSSSYGSRVVGYMICSWAVGEWMAWCIDSSRPMTERFREFLKKKYRTRDALCKAWGNPDVRFETAEAPRIRDHNIPGSQSFYEAPKHQHIMDYWESYAEVVSDALLGITKAAKEACNYESVITVSVGYLLQFGALSNYHGHTALREIIRSPTVDALGSPSCYHRRSLTNGYSYFMGPPEVPTIHGKVWWNENDYRTYLQSFFGKLDADEVAAWTEEKRRKHYDMMRISRIVGITESLEDSISHQQREVANSLCHNAGMWWFDMEGGWFAERSFMKAIGRMHEVSERSLAFDRSSATEIAVVIDAKGMVNTPIGAHIGSSLIIQQTPLLGRIGAPFGTCLLEDIDEIPDHKLWIFLNCFAPSKRAREAIRRKVKRSGQVAVWLYAPGLIDAGKRNLEQAAELTGITLEALDTESPMAVAVTEAGHPLTDGLIGTVYGASGSAGGELREEIWRGGRGPSVDKSDWDSRYRGTLVKPTVFSKDKEATVLGYLTGVPEPGLVVKPQRNWTSVQSSCGPLPPQLLRNLARFAGAHLYVETDDVLYANRSFMSVTTNSGGERTIRLPRKCDVVETYSGKVVARGVSEFSVNIPPKTTHLYYLGDADRWFRA